VKLIFCPKLTRLFKWHIVDTLIVLEFVAYLVANSITTDFGKVIEYRGGRLLDTLVPYFAFRVVIIDKKETETLIKGALVVLVFLAIMGVVESLTGKSIYDTLQQYRPYTTLSTITEKGDYAPRYGFNRAFGPTSHPIMFGLSFAIFFPLVWYLRRQGKIWKFLTPIFAIMVALGCLSSMSSGPWLALGVVLFCLFLERFKFIVKSIVYSLLAFILLIEAISTRHFYYILAQFAMSEETAWYRARLLDVAIVHLPVYWAFGYGLVDPGWGREIQGLEITDIVNHYVLIASECGIICLAIFISIFFLCFKGICRFSKVTTDPDNQSFCWVLGTVLVALVTVMWSVSLFGPPLSLLYIIFGMAANFYVDDSQFQKNGVIKKQRKLVQYARSVHHYN
jgi:hypothetical protein